MKPSSALAAQFRAILPMVGLISLVSAAGVGVVLLIHVWKGAPVGALVRDPTAYAEIPFYTGFLSSLGVVFWSATTAVCLFSARQLARRPEQAETARFLLASGLLTLLLTVDDLYLLHDEVFLFHLGQPERRTFAVYAALTIAYLIRFRRFIFQTEFLLFGLALGCFATSVLVDIMYLPGYGINLLLEEGPKFAGIVTWLAYFVRVSGNAIQAR